MFTNPTTPNATDYLAFLYGTVGIPRENFPSASGTAMSGSSTTLTDSSAAWLVNQWAAYNLDDLTQGETSIVISNTSATLTFAAMPLAVAPGDAYLIAPQWLFTTLAVAQGIVNEVLSCLQAPLYVLAVYNLATDRLINYASDVAGQTFFMDQRTKFRLLDVSVGVSAAASDQGTAVGILNPEVMKNFTLANLQYMKTPWGREYLGIAQSVGTLWGLS